MACYLRHATMTRSSQPWMQSSWLGGANTRIVGSRVGGRLIPIIRAEARRADGQQACAADCSARCKRFAFPRMVRRRGCRDGGCVGRLRFTPPADGEKSGMGRMPVGIVSGENRCVAVWCVTTRCLNSTSSTVHLVLDRQQVSSPQQTDHEIRQKQELAYV